MYVEVRKRLGVANVYVPFDAPIHQQLMRNDTIELHVQNSSILTLVANHLTTEDDARFVWPKCLEKVGKPVDSKYKQMPNSCELTFRIPLAITSGPIDSHSSTYQLLVNPTFLCGQSKNRAEVSQPACFSNDYEHKKMSKKLEGPTHFAENLNFFCESCKRNLSQVKCTRLLPLPAINWKDSSHDWFCGCVHTTINDSPDTKMKEEARTQEITCGANDKLTNSRDNSITNRQLSTASLSPRLGDILYTNAFLCLNMSSFVGQYLQEMSIDITFRLVYCSHCRAELGLSSDENTGERSWIQFWHHAVNVTDKELWSPSENKKGPMDTIRNLVEALFDESGKPFLKLILKEFGGVKRALFLWVLERDLCLVIPENSVPDMEKRVFLREHSVMKVLFNLGHNKTYSGGTDIDVISVTIGTSMMDAVLCHLKQNTKMIPETQRYQKGADGDDLNISYISKEINT